MPRLHVSPRGAGRGRPFSGARMAPIALAILAVALMACDSDSDPVTAAQVSYEPSAGLTATRVQGAVDELAGRVQAAEGELTTAAADREGLSGRIDALEQAPGDELVARVTSLEGRVEALEDAPPAPPAAADVAVAPIAGLEGDDVQGALAALQARLASVEGTSTALQAEVDTLVTQVDTLNETITAQAQTIADLEGALAALEDCPEGMTAVGDACVEDTPRSNLGPENALVACMNAGLRPCTYVELQQHCKTDVPWGASYTGEEWVGDFVDAGVLLTVDFNSVCGMNSQGTKDSGNAAFRCCKTR